jgi:hypothetical protein
VIVVQADDLSTLDPSTVSRATDSLLPVEGSA